MPNFFSWPFPIVYFLPANGPNAEPNIFTNVWSKTVWLRMMAGQPVHLQCPLAGRIICFVFAPGKHW